MGRAGTHNTLTPLDLLAPQPKTMSAPASAAAPPPEEVPPPEPEPDNPPPAAMEQEEEEEPEAEEQAVIETDPTGRYSRVSSRERREG